MKQRLQTGQFANVSAAVRGIVSKEGVRGLYAGHASFLLRDLPFDAIEFVAYEQVRADAHTHTLLRLGFRFWSGPGPPLTLCVRLHPRTRNRS